MARNYKQGTYEPNWDKYIGTKVPRYLSSWEKYVFEYLDRNPNVIKWGSEVVVVPYMSMAKSKDGITPKKARYMVDIYAEFIGKDGKKRIEIIEVKPLAQLSKPARGKKKESSFIQESLTYANNIEKWKAAAKYADERGWNFRIITERSLFRG